MKFWCFSNKFQCFSFFRTSFVCGFCQLTHHCMFCPSPLASSLPKVLVLISKPAQNLIENNRILMFFMQMFCVFLVFSNLQARRTRGSLALQVHNCHGSFCIAPSPKENFAKSAKMWRFWTDLNKHFVSEAQIWSRIVLILRLSSLVIIIKISNLMSDIGNRAPPQSGGGKVPHSSFGCNIVRKFCFQLLSNQARDHEGTINILHR